MGGLQPITHNTRTSTAAIAKSVAELVEEQLPDVIRRVVDVDRASGLAINITIKPGGRTEAAKDPEVVITATPKWGESVVKLKARLKGEGDDAQLSLIQQLVQGEVGFEGDGTGESGDEAQAATG